MTKNIINLPFFTNQTQNGFSQEIYLKNGGKVSMFLEGVLDGAKIKFYVKHLQNSNYVPYVSGVDIIYQTVEGKEFEIEEEMPCFLKVELLDATENTNITVTGFYFDKFSDYGII